MVKKPCQHAFAALLALQSFYHVAKNSVQTEQNVQKLLPRHLEESE